MRDALLGVTRTLDARGPHTRSHANRVGRLAAAIARHLGCDENDTRNVELAARLHGLELVATAEMQGIPSLAAIDEIMRWSRRSGASWRSMPVAAQIVAAANVFDVMTSGAGGTRLTRPAALAELRSQKRRFRPEVIDAMAAAVQPRRATPPRRRGADRRVPDTLDAHDEVEGTA